MLFRIQFSQIAIIKNVLAIEVFCPPPSTKRSLTSEALLGVAVVRRTFVFTQSSCGFGSRKAQKEPPQDEFKFGREAAEAQIPSDSRRRLHRSQWQKWSNSAIRVWRGFATGQVSKAEVHWRKCDKSQGRLREMQIRHNKLSEQSNRVLRC